MVVRLRFSMHGPRHNKFLRLIAINGKQRRDAKPIETLGVYRHTVDPSKDRSSKLVEWSVSRIKYWLDVGAQPSKSAVRLFTLAGILPPDSKYHPSSNRRQLSSEDTRTESKPSASESLQSQKTVNLETLY